MLSICKGFLQMVKYGLPKKLMLQDLTGLEA